MRSEELLQTLLDCEPTLLREEKSDVLALIVEPQRFFNLAVRLVRAPFSFDLLVSHTAVHWQKEDQFELLYRLHSTLMHHQLLLITKVPVQQPEIPSVSRIWRIAEWQEREVFDLFGVRYADHPDLRRLFLEDDWQGFPLRKDYKDDFMLEGPEWEKE